MTKHILTLVLAIALWQTIAAQTLYFNDFESNNWGMFEEIVGGNACYEDNIGEVALSTEQHQSGAGALRVWANQAGSNFSNHVIGQHQLYSDGLTGQYRYRTYFYVPSLPAEQGQTGPEFSVQSTRLSGGTNLTYVAGIQYVNSPYVTDKWNIWHNGNWVIIDPAQFNLLLATDTWYLLELDFDLDANAYLSLHVEGNGTNTTLPLSQPFFNAPNGYLIAGEDRGFSPATWLTLESENLWTTCSQNRSFKMFYDDVELLEIPGCVAEVCNGVDDDCDGLIDEGFGACCNGGGGSGTDLIVPTATAPSSAHSGQQISVCGIVKNIGNVKAPHNSKVRWYLSNDAVWSASDYTESNWKSTIHKLNPGEEEDFDKNFHLPSNGWCGAKYLIFKADGENDVVETCEENNAYSLPIFICCTNADLKPQNQNAPNNANAGQTITVSAKVKNSGSGAAGASKLKYYLSDDNTFGNGDDMYLGFNAAPPLAAGANSGTLSAVVIIPANAASGSYRIFYAADADGEVCEINENNNVEHRNITISPPQCLVSLPGSNMVSMQEVEPVVGFAEDTRPEISGNNLRVEVFPNPTDGKLTVDVEAAHAADCLLLVHDSQGRLVHRDVIENEAAFQRSVDLSGLAAGVYSVTVSGTTGIFSTKVLKL